MVKTLDIDSKMELEQGKDLPISETHPSDSIFALSFTSSVPLLLNRVQSIVTDQMFHSKGLIRAKGLLWLNENRQIRLIFHWSGKKRSEATYNGQWECPPFNSIVFIGLHINELESLKHAFEDSQVGLHTIISNPSTSQGCKANSFIDTLATDSRFKVQRKDPQGVDFTHDVQTCITFGLIGSPLQGISEADLNEALMHLVNAQGILFLTAVTSSREGYLLQIALDTSKNDFENMWKELSMAAALVRAKFFKNIHRCRCDLKEHIH
ncbi:hypothetical protein L7F22_032238 [Adiantum nelumboides]|nr:hypothetical protein [Adiantum nelumboides]